MRKKLVAAAIAAAALAAGPMTAAPAHAEETHICSAFAPPYDQPCWLVMNRICRQPLPPLTICR